VEDTDANSVPLNTVNRQCSSGLTAIAQVSGLVLIGFNPTLFDTPYLIPVTSLDYFHTFDL
jgi:hypothetical protein